MRNITLTFVAHESSSTIVEIIPNYEGSISLVGSDSSDTVSILPEDALILAIEIIKCHKKLQSRLKKLENKLKI